MSVKDWQKRKRRVNLEDYKVHQDPPGISGPLVDGRICYDAFVLDNKAKAIYYQATIPTA
ncbi:MAG: hypothetical protein MR936_14995 [Eubacterium sp.]|nr:hypothetical protein [Eubacterium sp.]